MQELFYKKQIKILKSVIRVHGIVNKNPKTNNRQAVLKREMESNEAVRLIHKEIFRNIYSIY